ncbi:hypothetical protein SAMN06295945_0128 [Polynucleobacter meluiroseus]|uniref:Uncharacterized protein n=1 Tax=Polynucleobacter meluiroseus TaxID=1938814 RepID=A0A240DY12_9BURK|nr:hypothetical protein SAMN06295945_0128 [Polynucleobacter meluiroseus]
MNFWSFRPQKSLSLCPALQPAQIIGLISMYDKWGKPAPKRLHLNMLVITYFISGVIRVLRKI